MNRNESLPIPVWFLEHIEDTLRIENNINIDKGTGETCQDRNIKQALSGVRKLLSGEELTGNERFEPLKSYKAEKDLALTWEDVKVICDIEVSMYPRGIEMYSKEYYEEVLKRFNELKITKK